MANIQKFLLFFVIAICFSACGNDNEPNGPDINNVNSSLDTTFAKLIGKYSSTWSETLNDVTYNLTFTPYTTPKNEDIRISDGGNINYTKKVRIFGRVNLVKTYSFSNGYTYEQENKNYLYGIETTLGEPYEMIFYPFSSIGEDDIIYGLSSSYYIKNISNDSFNLSVGGKNGDYHLFEQ